MIKKKHMRIDWGFGVEFLSGRFSLYKSSELAFKRYISFFLRILLKEYRCYSFILIENNNSSKIEKRKSEIKLTQLTSTNKFVYLDMDGGTFACFEVGLFNFDKVYGKQIYFAFSKNPDFMLSISESLNSYSYDGFIETLLLLNHCDKDQSLLAKVRDNPILTRIHAGDIFIETSFPELFPDEKLFGLCYKRDFCCPILGKMLSESFGEEEPKLRFELLR